MNRVIIIIALSFIAFLNVHAGNHIEYKDSITNVILQLPEGSEVIPEKGFQRATISLDKTDIKIYSMKSEDGKQFSWAQVNNFDSNDEYGKLIRYERISEKCDGWIRYYADKTKQGRDYVTCVALVRGQDYAFYMTEAAYREENLSMRSILEGAIFPKATTKVKSKTFVWFAMILEFILVFFGVIFFRTIKKMPVTVFWIAAIVTVIGSILSGVLFLGYGWRSIFAAFLCACSWKIASASDSRWSAITKVAKHIKVED